jgi:thioredoxin-related protein
VARRSFVVCFSVVFSAFGSASAAPHPFHDDGGAVNWKWSLATALDASKKTGKPIFIDACRESCGICRHLAETTLKDAKTSQMINRHFIPLVIDVDNAPAPIQELFAKVKGETLPFIMFVSDKGEFVQGSSGYRSPEQFRGDMEKTLGNNVFLLPKKNEAELTKQTDALAKLLEAKSYGKAAPTLFAISKFKGYSPLKDKVYDLLDAAQADATKKVIAAVKLAEENDYSKAREALSGVSKEYAGLPVADQVKDQLAALKLLETAHQVVMTKKGQWKMTATQQLTLVVDKYGDTPFATLAVKRRKDLPKSN